MIRTDREYKQSLQTLDEVNKAISAQKEALTEHGLTDEQIARATAPSLSFRDQLQEQIERYERLKRGAIEPLYSLSQLGRFIIGARIATGISQRELAGKLGVSETTVSRDEKNEYHGVTIDRAQRILEALGVKIKIEINKPGFKSAA